MNLFFSILLIFAAAFTLIAAIGSIRMPGFYMKMHAVTKAGSFGGCLLLVIAGFFFGSAQLLLVSANILFFYFTTPVAAQMISNAAFMNKVKPSDCTAYNEIDD